MTQGNLPASRGGASAAGAPGTMGLIAPTRVIDKPRETLRIDGVDIEFTLTPEAGKYLVVTGASFGSRRKRARFSRLPP